MMSAPRGQAALLSGVGRGGERYVFVLRVDLRVWVFVVVTIPSGMSSTEAGSRRVAMALGLNLPNNLNLVFGFSAHEGCLTKNLENKFRLFRSFRWAAHPHTAAPRLANGGPAAAPAPRRPDTG
jgi:hypothetical protein